MNAPVPCCRPSLIPRSLRRIALVLLRAAPCVVAAAVLAAPVDDAVRPLRMAGAVGEATAAAAAQAATGGKVVGVRRSGDLFEVTVLMANGQVRVVRVDAASGRVLGS